MADEFYVTVEGTRTGLFSEESTVEAHQGKLVGIGFHYSLESPRDPASGMATGRRIHHPVTFVKEWGAATPEFFNALCTNEVLTSVLFEFVGAHPETGEEYAFHKIRLTNATVSAIEQFIGPDPGVEHRSGPLERISLTFQKIEVDNVHGRTTAVDEWRGR